MQIVDTAIAGVKCITPLRHGDARGYFAEIYREETLRRHGIDVHFVQENQSLSVRQGTIRGLHFQRPPAVQAKLVRVLRGSIFDVAVDLRAGSATFGKWVGATLTASGGEQLFIPQGFAHGFCTLEADVEVGYKCDAYYAPAAEGGLHYADPSLAIAWPAAAGSMIASDRDRALPYFATFKTPFLMAGTCNDVAA